MRAAANSPRVTIFLSRFAVMAPIFVNTSPGFPVLNACPTRGTASNSATQSPVVGQS